MAEVPTPRSASSWPRPGIADERLRALLERIPAIFYVELDDESRTTYISARITDVLGYETERYLVESEFWLQIVHPDDRDAALAADARADVTGEPYTCEYRLRDERGEYHWFHDEAVFVRDEDGVGYWQGVMFEISDQKRTELELRETAAKLSTLVEQIPAVVYIEGRDGSGDSPVYISPRYEELFGYTAEERLADPTLWVKLLHPEDRSEAVARAKQAAETGEPFSMDYRMVARDGHIVWIHDETELVRDEDGSPLFWQGVLFDITERKHAEDELRQALEIEQRAVEQLQDADELKNTFLAAVSHDLRAPLATILGTAVTLEHEEEMGLDPQERRDMIHGLAAKARRLTALVANLLDMERLSRGSIELDRASIDLARVVSRAVGESEALEGRSVHLHLQPAVADVDAAIVERIVENLLVNAAKHTPPESAVWVRVEPGAAGVLLLVEDDGPGVPSTLRESLFRPFEQGASASDQVPGVGLGLSLIRRFAELHGGRAWVEERAGGGASFRVLLPAGDPAA
jgi:PAS domain S-box-containing protein